MQINNRQKGFTLLEVMVVIVILGILASMVVPNLMGNKDKADQQKAVSDIVALENALDMYKLDNGVYPTTEQGLEALVQKPTISPEPRNYREEGYVKRLPQDPWRNNYLLLSQAKTASSIFSAQAQMVNQVPKMISVTGIYRISNKMLKLRQTGFTLMEVMLVILLMGLTAAAVTMSIGNSGPQQALERTAQQFMAATELVLDETVLSGQFIGVVIEKTSYQFVFYKDGKWNPLEKDRMLSEKQMETGVSLNLVLDGLPLVQEDEEEKSWFDEPFIEAKTEDKKKHPEPQIMLFPSGEMSAFELSFIAKTDKGQIDVLVVGDALGRLTLGRPDEIR